MALIASLADLGELIESHQDELLSNWYREVAFLPGAENLDGPTIKFRLMVTSDTDLAIAYNLERRLTSIQNVFPFNVHRQ